MKILGVKVCEDSCRFIKGFPPKGAFFFIRPNIEFARLASVLSPDDEFTCIDERIEEFDPNLVASEGYDLVLLYCDFGDETRAQKITSELKLRNQKSAVFGPLPSFWKEIPNWTDIVIKGNILSVFNDLQNGFNKKVYEGKKEPVYYPAQSLLFTNKRFLLNIRFQAIQAVLGCFCPEKLKPFCPHYLYFGQRIKKRDLKEVIGEIVSLPYKHIHLLDDDLANFPDYYREFFSWVWDYRKYWTANTSPKIFDNPNLIRLLRKSGIKVLFLNEDWLNLREFNIREKRRQVKYLQSNKMLVGTRAALFLNPEETVDFDKIFLRIRRLDLDFLELRVFSNYETHLNSEKRGVAEPLKTRYHPEILPTQPQWLKNRFYSLSSILNRIVRRPRRVGFYTTLVYLLPQNLAYRQNFLEGIPYPP